MRLYNIYILFLFFTDLHLSASTDSLKPPSEQSKAEAKQKLQTLRERIIKGDNFYTLARLYSDDPQSRVSGGCYEKIKKGMFVAAFEEVAFNLKENEVSEIVETSFGFHLIKLKARRGDEIDVCHILITPK